MCVCVDTGVFIRVLMRQNLPFFFFFFFFPYDITRLAFRFNLGKTLCAGGKETPETGNGKFQMSTEILFFMCAQRVSKNFKRNPETLSFTWALFLTAIELGN